MENSRLVPFIDKVNKMEDREYLLLRLIDDFLFISTSKKKAEMFLTRVERGFFEYNCNMNKEKFGSNIDGDISIESNRVYFDKNGRKFLR